MDEFLRTPRGFNVHGATYLDVFSRVVEITRQAGRLNFNAVFLPPVSFASTFGRVGGTSEGRSYEFHDRKGRRLVLTPDSSAALLRWYLTKHSNADPARAVWICPVTRYRRQRNRHFYQFGIATINEGSPGLSAPDLYLAEAASSLIVDYLLPLGIEIHVRVYDIGLLRQLAGEACNSESEAERLVQLLQFAKNEHSKLELVSNLCTPSKTTHLLSHLLAPRLVAEDSLDTRSRRLLKAAVDRAETFTNMLRGASSTTVDFSLVRSTQTLSGMGFELLTANGARIGDGGRYDKFGSEYSEKISSFVSVCAGVEALSRNIPQNREEVIGICVITYPDCYPEVIHFIEKLRHFGVVAALRLVRSGGRKEASLLLARFRYVTVIGQQDLIRGTMLIECRRQGSTELPIDEVALWLIDELSQTFHGRNTPHA